MLRLGFAVLVLGACGNRSEPVPAHGSARVAGDAGVDAGVPQPIVTAPHGGQISVVAITDHADAAISADENGELRFWPALDGKREPIVIHGRMPTDLAIAEEHDGHIAALLDAAAGIELLHIAKDGALQSRQVMPAEPGFEELVAAKSVLLARRTDHTITRLDANTSKATRTLAPEMGEQVLGIAARGNTAVAGIADRERPSEIRIIREIRLTGDLVWGTAYELPVPLAPPFAVSPSGHRIAGLHARTGAGAVIELGAKPRVIASDIVGTDPAENAIGFLDEDRVVFRGGVVLTMPQVTVTADPWSGTRSTQRVRLGRSAVIADDAVVGGLGTHLLIADGDHTLFLGYRDLGVGFLRVTGNQTTLGFGNRVMWLDDNLTSRRTLDVMNDAAGGIAVDDSHLLKATYSYLENDRSKLDIALFDAAAGTEVALGSFSQGSAVAYDPTTGVFAVSGYSTTITRSHLDLVARTSSPLRPLKARADSTVELLDPKLAGGAIAVTYTHGENGIHIETFVDDGKGTKPISPASSVKVVEVLFPIGVDQTGTMYTLVSRPETQPKPIYAHKGGKEVKRIMVDGAVTAGAVDRAGTMLAAYSNANVFLYGLDGKERWRVPSWSVNIARFAADGKTLLVNTQGGLMALDTMTGARRATGCGWGFGLSTTEPQLTIFLTPVVCAEAP